MLKYNSPPLLIFYATCVCLGQYMNISDKFEAAGLVPKFIPVPPKHLCQIFYASPYPEHEGALVEVNTNEKMKELNTRTVPYFRWPTRENALYTAYMAGVIIPPMEELSENITQSTDLTTLTPEPAQWEEYVRINIPANNLTEGEEILPYQTILEPHPLVREYYVVLIYEQPGELKMADDEVKFKEGTGYVFDTHHTITRFVKKYNLGEPWAGNYFINKRNDVEGN